MSTRENVAATMARHGSDPATATATRQALAWTSKSLGRQAAASGFADAFTLLGFVLLAAIPLIWLLPRGSGQTVHGH